MLVKLTTFNLENLGIRPGEDSLEARRRLPAHIATLRTVLKDVAPDILCLQEIIDPDCLNELVADLGFNHVKLCRPPKNPLCTALLSRHPILSAECVVAEAHLEARDIDDDFTASIKADFSRPVFQVEVNLNGRILTIYNLHWKSKIPTPLSSGAGQTWPWANFHEVAQGRMISEVTRMCQALGLRKLIDNKLKSDPQALLAVCGDFNDVTDSEAVRMILGDARAVRTSELLSLELWPCESVLPPEKSYTMVYRGQKQMLDHILISRYLRDMLLETEVHHQGMKTAKEGGWADLRPGSDHAPLSAVFDFKD